MEEKKINNPICAFEKTKTALRGLGYQVDPAIGYHQVENVDINLDAINNELDFTSEGIFLKDVSTGAKYQIFLYKRDYHIRKYGKPRFHIRKCAIIDEFIQRRSFNSHYRRANSEPVMVIDLSDGHKDKEISNLPLCKYCLKMAYEESSEGMTSSDFVQLLKEINSEINNDSSLSKEVDLFGYTRDWPEISRTYREKKKFTCERCGIKITNLFDQAYIHVHHKNGDKTDNKVRNLECLCVKCHSEVDDIHRRRFDSSHNKLILNQFKKKYSLVRKQKC